MANDENTMRRSVDLDVARATVILGEELIDAGVGPLVGSASCAYRPVANHAAVYVYTADVVGVGGHRGGSLDVDPYVLRGDAPRRFREEVRRFIDRLAADLREGVAVERDVRSIRISRS